MTLPEVLVWQVLRLRPEGLRFRRQHPIGTYVLDFYCPAVKLAIEIDGSVHETGDHPTNDARRDAWLADNGVSTFRVRAIDVLADLDAVVRGIVARCLSLHHLPVPGGPPPHAVHGEE